MVSSHTKVGPEPRVGGAGGPGRAWYGKRRKAGPRKATPKGGYDRYRGYDAPPADVAQRAKGPTIDLALSAFGLGLIALLLAFIPIIRYLGVLFAIGAVIIAVRELRTHDAVDRVQYKGEAARAERFARLGRFFGVCALVIVVATTLWGIKEGYEDRAKARPGATGQVLDQDLEIGFSDFTRSVDPAGVVTMGVEVTLKNTSDDRRSFDIQIEALTDDGRRVAADRLLQYNLIAGEERTVAVFTAVSDATAAALADAEFRVATAVSMR